MRQILLAIFLIAAPVGIFTAFELWNRPAASAQSLGDLSGMSAIVTDVSALADKGDLPAAATRITDLETAWDEAQPRLQPLAPEAWGALDGRIDAALSVLRVAAPDAGAVKTALADLATALADPAAAMGTGGVALVAGIAVTDGAGHPLPCEAMLAGLRDGLGKDGLAPATKAAATGLQAKATERCNADDDAHADAFSAQALALIAK